MGKVVKFERLQPHASEEENALYRSAPRGTPNPIKANFLIRILAYIGKFFKRTLLLIARSIVSRLYSALTIIQSLFVALSKLVCLVVTVLIAYQFFATDSPDYQLIASTATVYPAAFVACSLYDAFLNLAHLGKHKADNAIARGLGR
ncbi:hypothetical protein [Halomonas sp. 3A7M]|uniref:hypothetical protein n=1 Tax=Halomonas sp. 3A7M TaxID=2742616 RepID=UPI00186817A1|nr:hypothetical protein [Halomonas sp. 3A7M]